VCSLVACLDAHVNFGSVAGLVGLQMSIHKLGTLHSIVKLSYNVMKGSG